MVLDDDQFKNTHTVSPDQEMLISASDDTPSPDWSRSDLQGRKKVVERHYSQGAGVLGQVFDNRFGSMARDSTLSRLPSTPSRLITDGGGRFSGRATQDVSTLLGSKNTMPIADIKEAGRPANSVDPFSEMGQQVMSSNEGGNYNPLTGEITYKRTDTALDRRAVLTHESAHSLQDDLTRHEADLELDKIHRHTASNIIDQHRSGPVGPGTDTPEDDSLVAGLRQQGRRLGFKPELSWMESHPIHDPMIQLPISEGTADAYQKMHTAASGRYGYSPEQFHNHSPEMGYAFEAAQARTYHTGRVIRESEIRDLTKLAGVLDHDDSSRRDEQPKAVQRMATARFDPENTIGMPEDQHAANVQEHRTRQKAVSGEVIQGTMFPDVVPETDQFGGPLQFDPSVPEDEAPFRSYRGEALFRGEATEKAPGQTIPAEARRQSAIRSERLRNRPSPDFTRESRHHRKLQEHVKEKKSRDEGRASRKGSGKHHEAVTTQINKFVYDRKRDYAQAYADWKAFGGDEPSLPEGLKEDHADKARNSIDRVWAKHNL